MSRRTWRSLGQVYRIYPDRLELQTLLGTKRIPFGDIVSVDVRPPLVVGDAFRGKPFAYWAALKVDLADLARHIAIYRRRGLFRCWRITPDNPEVFAAQCSALLPAADAAE